MNTHGGSHRYLPRPGRWLKMKWQYTVAIAITAVCVLVGTMVAASATLEDGSGGSGSGGGSSPFQCTKSIFVAAMGSGQYFAGTTNLGPSPQLTTLYTAIQSTAGASNTQKIVINYPATSVNELFSGVSATNLQSQLQNNISTYLGGEKAGLSAMWSTYNSIRFWCPSTKIALGGYSQGSMVVHEFLNELAATNDSAGKKSIVGAVLLADPERVRNSSVVELGDAQYTSYGVCDLLSKAVSCAAPDKLADISSTFTGVTDSVCYLDDPICDTSQLLSYLGVAWNAGARNSVINLAELTHASYSYMPGTSSAGRLVGQRIARS